MINSKTSYDFSQRILLQSLKCTLRRILSVIKVHFILSYYSLPFENSKLAKINVNAIKINFRKSCFIRGSSIKSKNKQTSNLCIQLYMFPKSNSSAFCNFGHNNYFWPILKICWSRVVENADYEVASLTSRRFLRRNDCKEGEGCCGRSACTVKYSQLFLTKWCFKTIFRHIKAEFRNFSLWTAIVQDWKYFRWMSKIVFERTRQVTWLCTT